MARSVSPGAPDARPVAHAVSARATRRGATVSSVAAESVSTTWSATEAYSGARSRSAAASSSGIAVEPRPMFGSRGTSRRGRRRSQKPHDDPAAPQRLGRRRRGSHRQPPTTPAVEARRPTPGPPTPPGASRPRPAPRGASRGVGPWRAARARRCRRTASRWLGEEAADRRLAAPHHPDQHHPARPVDRHPRRRSSSSSQASSRGVCSA